MRSGIKIWAGLIPIIIVSWIYNAYFSTPASTTVLRRGAFHIICLLSIAGIGYWALAKARKRWVKRTWLLFYAVALSVLLLTGFLRWKFNGMGDVWQDYVRTFINFFLSPLPFLLMLLLTTRSFTTAARNDIEN
ncbi:MAG: hypothetical protein H0X33_10695 [Taibaiella sp.]|nr:hypothetical protein [Taibaiella sp.]